MEWLVRFESVTVGRGEIVVGDNWKGRVTRFVAYVPTMCWGVLLGNASEGGKRVTGCMWGGVSHGATII